jgi:hypothetical protein
MSIRCSRLVVVLGLGLASLGAGAQERSPWRVWSLDRSGAPPGLLRWLPALAAEPQPELRAGELPRLRPAISLSRGGPVVLSLVPRGADGLLVTLQFRP